MVKHYQMFQVPATVPELCCQPKLSLVIVRWSESPCNQSGRKGKGLWRKGFTG